MIEQAMQAICIDIDKALKHWELLNIICIGKTGDKELTDALQYALDLIDERVTELKKELSYFGEHK